MEAGRSFLRSSPLPWTPKRTLPRPFDLSFPRVVRASSSPSSSEKRCRGPKPTKDWVADWVLKNDDLVRSLPIYVGGVSLSALLFNRTVSGIAPVADASSSQSRADLLTLGLAVTNILAGLVWLSIRPKTIFMVSPEGIECRIINPDLPNPVVSGLLWSLVIVYNSSCILQLVLRPNPQVEMESLLWWMLNYLANLSLYSRKSELPFLPSNTQSLGYKGIAVIGGDTIRGFTTSDQAWISFTGEKLDATLSKYLDNLPFALLDRV